MLDQVAIERPPRGSIARHATHVLTGGVRVRVWLFEIAPGCWQYAAAASVAGGWKHVSAQTWQTRDAFGNDWQAHVAALDALRHKLLAGGDWPVLVVRQLEQLAEEVWK